MAKAKGIKVEINGGGVAGHTADLKPRYRKGAKGARRKGEIGRRRTRTLQIAADGRSRAVHEIQLPANAIVNRYDLSITATRAELVPAASAADLREAEGPNNRPALVVDFGTLRTVNAVLLPIEHAGHQVYPWLGTRFEDEAIELPGSGVDKVARSLESGAYDLYIYPMPETRSERLLIVLGDPDADLASVMAVLELSLPELPADLSLRINAGAPVWEHAGTVQPGAGTELSDGGWTRDGRRRVSIAEALEEFSGDAANPVSETLALELTSSVPGRLLIQVEAQELQLLHRLAFNDADQLVLDFPSEGAQQLAVAVPAGEAGPRTLQGLRLSVAGDLPPERVLPPLGPEASGLGELVLGKGRAACVRLSGGEGLAELTGVRLPLNASAGGAEARVVLWRDEGGLPVEALGEAVSEPVSWDESGERWLSFPFADSIPFDAASPPWAALTVSRGQVTWALAAGGDSGDYTLRLGPPEGPWRALPAVFGAGTALGRVVGRARMMGLAADTQPMAPILLAMGTSAGEESVTPVADGLLLQLDTQAAAISPDGQLVITSRTAGTVTLSEIDAITDA